MIMFALALMFDVAPGVNVSRDGWIEVGSRFECAIQPGPSDLDRVVFLFPVDQQPGQPQVWVFETYRSGSSTLSRTSASELPPPPSQVSTYRKIITFGQSVFETVTPTDNSGVRWSYERTDGAGGNNAVVTRGTCNLIVEHGR